LEKIKIVAIATIILSATLFASPNIEIGGGVWLSTASGTGTYDSGSGADGHDIFKNNNKTYAYAYGQAYIPIPIIPNIRLSYSKVGGDGNPVGVWGGYTFSSGATSTLSITQYDVTPFYNLVNNTYLTINFGVTARFLKIKYNIMQTGVKTYHYAKNLVVPMGYMSATVNVPDTNIGVTTSGKYISYNGSVISDFNAKIAYTFTSIAVIHPSYN